MLVHKLGQEGYWKGVSLKSAAAFNSLMLELEWAGFHEDKLLTGWELLSEEDK